MKPFYRRPFGCSQCDGLKALFPSRFLSISLLILTAVLPAAAQVDEHYDLSSPDGRLRVEVKITDRLYYRIHADGEALTWYSPLSMTLGDGTVLGGADRPVGVERETVRQILRPVWGIQSEILDHCNELRLAMPGGYRVVFRAYDNGVAYRFGTDLDHDVTIKTEEVAYHFPEDPDLMFQPVRSLQSSYELIYSNAPLSQIAEEQLMGTPLLVRTKRHSLLIAESDVYGYPGMYLKHLGYNNRFELKSVFPALPTRWEPGGWSQFNLDVTERADCLAEVEGRRTFPWRITMVAREEHELLENNLVYQLARPAAIDTSWIRPGKVAWDWWNDWNLKGVDFETGVNNRTYEYYIDFAAAHGIEYVIMDEGWSDQFDLFLQKPGIDVPHLVAYARERGVGIILWCVWHPLDRQMEPALDRFEQWGVAGIKVDFIDRDDAIAIDFYERLAREAAKRKLLIDYHGCSKPAGLHRTYPNVITYEAVRGNEHNKFSSSGAPPDHNINVAFARMQAGPMDYTPGAMRNSTEGNFRTDFSNPMSCGTRCHQLGMYVVYFSPLQMLCDAPTAYQAYPDILNFLSRVPVSWDETVSLAGRAGEYVVVARRKGAIWYLGALNNWDEREIAIDLSFLGEGRFDAHLFLDGVNADRMAEDYRYEQREVEGGGSLKLTLKKGGGMAGWFTAK